MKTSTQQNIFVERIPWFILISSLALTAIGVGVAIRDGKDRRASRFQSTIDAVEENLADEIESYLVVVWSLVGLFEANNLQVDKNQFKKFREALDSSERVRALAGLAFHERVPREKLAEHEKDPALAVLAKSSGPHDLVLLKYLEVYSNSIKKATAINSMEDPVRRQALNIAARTGRATATDLVTLASDELSGAPTPAIIIYAPIYTKDVKNLSENERPDMNHGFASASFRLNEFAKKLKRGTHNAPIGFRIYTRSSDKLNSDDPKSFLYDTGDSSPGSLKDSRSLKLAGRDFDIEFWSLSGFLEDGPEYDVVPLVSIAGTLLSLVLFALSLAQVREKKARELSLSIEKRRARDLQEMDRTKTSFFSNLSHELRTPLNGIIGMSNLLQSTEVNEEQKEYLDSISSCGQSLFELINDVLDFSKIKAGKMELRPLECDIKTPFIQAIQVVKGPAREKGLTVLLEWDSKIPPRVEIDEMRLRQVLTNLLGNAIKFTSQGSVTLAARFEEKKLVFEVQDTGIGISAENVAKLFKPFSQVNTEEAPQDQKGTGLGLHLCREILAAMDGDISIESQPGLGSTFRGCLPLTIIETVAEPTPAGQNRTCGLGSLKILVVDDNAMNRRVLALQLKQMGSQVVSAEGGYQALEASKKEAFDLILMDYQMPGMNGLETTRQLRASDSEETLIIGLTAFGEKEKHDDCEEAGMNAVLVKPVEMEKLDTLVLELLVAKSRRISKSS